MLDRAHSTLAEGAFIGRYPLVSMRGEFGGAAETGVMCTSELQLAEGISFADLCCARVFGVVETHPLDSWPMGTKCFSNGLLFRML